MSEKIKLSSVAVNCADAVELANFYADITGGEVTFAHPNWATMDGPGGRLDFQTVADYQPPPAWPGTGTEAMLHLDFVVDDLAATEARVLRAGAIRYEQQPNADHCLVFADPAGHPFCLTTLEDLG